MTGPQQELSPFHPAYVPSAEDELSELDWMKSIWQALKRIEEIARQQQQPPQIPAPVVMVDPPDLSAIVTAIQGLSPGVYPTEIANAIRDILVPYQQDNGLAQALEKVGQTLEVMEFRLRGTARSFGAGISGPLTVKSLEGSPLQATVSGPLDVSDRAARLLGHVTVDNTVAVTNSALSNVVGTWSYRAGTTGTVSITGRVLGVTAIAGGSSGTFTINGGGTITVPANSSLTIEPVGNLVSPSITFTGTAAFFVEFLS